MLPSLTLVLTVGCVTPGDTADTSDTSAPSDTADTSGDADSGDTSDTSDTSDSGDTADTGDTPACDSTCDCGDGELCYTGTCRPAPPEVDIWRARLDGAVAAMHGDGSFDTDGAYPTELLMSLASGAALLCDPGYADAAATRAAYARSGENADHLYQWSGVSYLSRDHLARHITNLHAAGVALGDVSLRQAADEVATAMMTHLERRDHDGRLLFCTTWRTSPPYECDAPPWIDTNQNAEVGLAFARLAADPDSALYQDPTALDIADQELAAATSVQTAAGEIPIAESGGYEDDYDTLYGSYTAMSWAIATAARPTDLALAAHADLAAAWLAPLSDGDPESNRTYPAPYSGAPSLAECQMRLPVLARAGVLEPDFVRACWAITADNSETWSLFMPVTLSMEAGLTLEQLLPQSGQEHRGEEGE